MKLTYTIAALLLSTAAAHAATDLSMHNDGLAHQIQCVNVPARSGSVDGFYAANIGFFVAERHADRATTDRIAGVVPAQFDVRDASDVATYLESVGLTNYALVIRSAGTKRSTVIGTEEVTETSVTPRGVALGGVPDRDNLTSMGNAVSDGAEIIRVRSTVDQDVSIRRAGGDTFVVSVGAGDTFVTVPQDGTYIATFQTTGTVNTKATGNQPFGDVTVTTTEVETITRVAVPDTGALAWCMGRRAAN